MERTSKAEIIKSMFLTLFVVTAGFAFVYAVIIWTGPSAEEMAEMNARAEAYAANIIAEKKRQERLLSECMEDMPEYQCEALLR